MERSWVAAAVIAAWVWMTIELVVWWWAWWRGREKVTGRLPYRAGLAAAAAALTTLAPVLLPALERAGIPLRGAAWALAAVVALSAVVAARRRALERAVRIRVPATVPTGGTLGIEGELPDLPGGGRVRITVWCERRRLVTTRGKLQREIVWHREVRHRIGTLPLAGGWRWVRERIGIPEDGPVSARGRWERVVWRVRLEAEGRRRVVADRPFEVVPGGAAEEALVREAEEVIAGFGEGEGPDLPPGAVATATGGGWRLEHRPL
ncbi:MAG TPA: hypothetical protein ENJ62_07875, partial [Bryobacterales bacterium]|nr:hypothetical protein [Bryobacterales bacterium]